MNAIFTNLARRALLNAGQHLEATDRYMRLALRAQGQVRATAETISAIKSGPAVFARQANIAQGPQQVYNVFAPARAGNLEIAPTELLETSHAERMDARPSASAGTGNSALEAVAVVDGPP